MTSGLCTGTIRHRRLARRDHRVAMGLYLLLLDHDELDRPHGPTAPTATGGPLGPERWWPVRYDRRDYLDGDPTVPLGDAVRDLVEARTGRRPAGPVQTLTQVRTFGYVFNPLTVHYCLAPSPARSGPDRLEVVVLEVTNTPWNERHCYVVDARPGAATAAHPGPVAVGHTDERGRVRAELPKQLHVSPFMGMDQTYHLTCTPPGDRLWLRLESFEVPPDGPGAVPVKVFDADLVLRREALTRRSLARRLVSHPLLTHRVWAGIHAHAVLLAARRVPFVPHPIRAGVRRPQEVDAGARRKGDDTS
ncbi:MAG TPA: DUF1365 domain-containing protein [Acidimicrobiales bacterium]